MDPSDTNQQDDSNPPSYSINGWEKILQSFGLDDDDYTTMKNAIETLKAMASEES